MEEMERNEAIALEQEEMAQEEMAQEEMAQEEMAQEVEGKAKKKWLPLFIGGGCVLILFIILAAFFGSGSGAKKVDRLINGIGTVSLQSEEKILKAEEALNALDEEEKETVENRQILTDARTSFDRIKKAFDAIGAIGEVKATEESGTLIATARTAYDACGEEEKKQVTNYATLEGSEEKYAALKVDIVIGLIEKIGTVTLKSSESITAARKAYTTLSDDQKGKVTNSAVLTAAEASLKALKAKESEKLLGKLNKTVDNVEGITWYMPKAYPNYINTRSFALPYIGINKSGAWLRVVMNYTGDDWIFWKSLTFSIDGEKSTKSVGYFNVERDNESGDVWETADYSATESDIALLEKIASSKSTVVRFQGDNYHYDLTVSANDKTAIRQVLDAYYAAKG